MFCIHCGSNNPDDARHCSRCGRQVSLAQSSAADTSFRAPASNQRFGEFTTATPQPTQHSAATAMRYGGFWVRAGALVIDGFVVNAVTIAVVLPFAFLVAQDNESWPEIAAVAFYVVNLLVAWLYPALTESSERQATIGKRAVGVVVTDTRGNRISFARATGRTVAKILNVLTLGIGWLIAAFTPQKRALHDYASGTLVVQRGEGRFRAAIIVVGVGLGVLLVFGIIAAISVPGLLRARIAGNEASAIGSLRAINSAQVDYASVCAQGRYATTLEDLVKPPRGETISFISSDLARNGVTKSGYRFTISADASDASQGAVQDTCNASAAPTARSYFASAEPEEPGTSGNRFFATDSRGTIYYSFSAIPNPIVESDTVIQLGR